MTSAPRYICIHYRMTVEVNMSLHKRKKWNSNPQIVILYMQLINKHKVAPIRNQSLYHEDVCRNGSQLYALLGTSVNCRKAAIRVVMLVRRFIRMEQLGSHWMNLYKVLHLTIFRKYIDKIQFLLKSDKDNVYFT